MTARCVSVCVVYQGVHLLEHYLSSTRRASVDEIMNGLGKDVAKKRCRPGNTNAVWPTKLARLIESRVVRF